MAVGLAGRRPDAIRAVVIAVANSMIVQTGAGDAQSLLLRDVPRTSGVAPVDSRCGSGGGLVPGMVG
jgi:hypothetical protein